MIYVYNLFVDYRMKNRVIIEKFVCSYVNIVIHQENISITKKSIYFLEY